MLRGRRHGECALEGLRLSAAKGKTYRGDAEARRKRKDCEDEAGGGVC